MRCFEQEEAKPNSLYPRLIGSMLLIGVSRLTDRQESYTLVNFVAKCSKGNFNLTENEQTNF